MKRYLLSLLLLLALTAGLIQPAFATETAPAETVLPAETSECSEVSEPDASTAADEPTESEAGPAERPATRSVKTYSISEQGRAFVSEMMNGSYSEDALTSAASAGLFGGMAGMPQQEIDLLGAEVVSLSHGGPLAFLSGAALAHIISRSLTAPELPLKKLVLETAQTVKTQFGHQYSQSFELSNLLNMSVALADNPRQNPVEAMEQLRCGNAAQALAGAVFACLAIDSSFDAAMIAAVNHSGRSAATGAVAGAILGLRLGRRALPDFYIECLEPGETLAELAYDVYHGCPMERGSKLFDLDWDRKYIHGGK